jgi:F420-dependent oxidoreductase-like protein
VRFGFKTAGQDTTFADALAVWRAADELEFFESGWTFDHFYPIFTEELDGPCLEGWVLTTALAQATERLRVGVLVTGMPYRHPAVLAKMAATLDHVAGGRLELGLGAGWNEVEATAYGIDLHATLTERFDAFDEGVEAIIALLTQDRTTYEGRYVRLADARCNPKPVQRPHPPICIGGQGERRTLRSVARYAQHWNYPGGPIEQFVAKLDVLRAHCDSVGRERAEITVSTHLLGTPEQVAEQAEAYRAAGLDLGIVYLRPPLTPAVLPDYVRALEPFAG